MSDKSELSSVMESILFVHGEPLSLERLAVITGEGESKVREALAVLAESYKNGGLILVEKDGGWQLGSRPENARYVEVLVKSEFSEELSRPALETIAIIAYKGPLTRTEIEYIRGVNSSFTLRALLMRGLVERIDDPKDARSYLYRVGFDFLKYLGLTRIEDLPQYEELRKEVAIEPPQQA